MHRGVPWRNATRTAYTAGATFTQQRHAPFAPRSANAALHLGLREHALRHGAPADGVVALVAAPGAEVVRHQRKAAANQTRLVN
jgi:hypothetical protein